MVHIGSPIERDGLCIVEGKVGVCLFHDMHKQLPNRHLPQPGEFAERIEARGDERLFAPHHRQFQICFGSHG